MSDAGITIRQPRPGVAALWLLVAIVLLGGVGLAIVVPAGTGARIAVVVAVVALCLLMATGVVYRSRLSSLTVSPAGVAVDGLFLNWTASWAELSTVERLPAGYLLLHPAPGVRLPSVGVPTRAAVARQLGRGDERFLPLIADRFDGGADALMAAFRRYAPASVTVVDAERGRG